MSYNRRFLNESGASEDIKRQARQIGADSPFVSKISPENELTVLEMQFDTRDLIEYVRLEVQNLKKVSDEDYASYYSITEGDLDKPIKLKIDLVRLRKSFKKSLGYGDGDYIFGEELLTVFDKSVIKYKRINDFINFCSKYTYRDLLGL